MAIPYSITGTITTQNLVPAGVATAGSAVEIVLDESVAALNIQVTGTYTGALSVQGTLDGTNWITLTGTSIQNSALGTYAATITTGQVGMFEVDISGYLRARVTALAAVTGTATVTLIGTSAATIVSMNSALPAGANLLGSVNLASSAGLGFGTYHVLISAATTNSTLVKSSNGCIGLIYAYNSSAAVKYLKLYNKASAPTVGTDTPVFVFTIPIAGSINISPAIGIRLFTGIGYAITGGQALLDTTAVAAGDVVVNIAYT